MKKVVLFIVLLTVQIHAQSPKASSGKVQRIDNFKSNFVDSRNIDVWLPEGYSDSQKYAVMYMHD